MLALGLIETKGLVGAIDAADAMLKAADVHLLEKTLATGGLVTITIAGEVAAVQASIDAARASLARIEGVQVISHHVIPRPDDELNHIMQLQPRIEEYNADFNGAAPVSANRTAAVNTTADAENVSMEQCKAMTTNKLRQLATRLGTSLTRDQIASANKQTLLKAIEKLLGSGKE